MISSVLLLILGFGVPFGYYYLKKNPQFGGKLTKDEKLRLQQSEHWKNGIFQNLSKTTMDMSLASLPKLIRESMQGRKTRIPKEAIPIIPFDAHKFKPDGVPKFVWYGHSVLLLQIDNKNLLIDPMFGSDASPVGPIRTKRFSKDSLHIINKLPPIDAILMTHDHYDHLDFGSMRLLKQKADRFLVPLGVGRHLEHWGVDKNKITEIDWWQEIKLFDLQLVLTPSRHFSGRGAWDRAKSLWGGWVIKSAKHSVYWSGDGGYDDHFKEVGERFGPFDWGFMECGQYNERWHQIHMYPEEAVQAALDAKVAYAIPVHWGAFSLALHHWKEPVARFITEAGKKDQPYLTPEPGEIVSITTEKTSSWWEPLN
ncbi:MBL fold metallo-hydrolase [Lutimonas vermicola]|uniref:MBL fold metallo-hydrolase n=1 Tax=Lutimonas vermicola TaxID=414288 RepID=A0ABU9KX24_9FLAO